MVMVTVITYGDRKHMVIDRKLLKHAVIVNNYITFSKNK